MSSEETQPDIGTCGFCGGGDGWLGEMGDETTERLEGVVRVGLAGKWTYEPHPNMISGHGRYVVWCGGCLGGLKHKFQRLDDHNLQAEKQALSFWLALDGLRWESWGVDGEEYEIANSYRDDTAVHIQKLSRRRRLHLLQAEQMRRAGAPLTSQGWLE